MERTVDYSHLQVFYRIAGKHTVLHCGLEALLDRGDELLGDVTALNLVDKLEVALEAFVNRLYAYDDIGKLTATTGLLLEYLAEFNRLGDGFLVGYLRTALVTFYLELAAQTVDDDVKVKLTHTRDDSLTGFLVGLYTEGRVFLSKLLESYAKLVKVLLGLGLYGDTDHGIGEFHCLEHDRCVFCTKGITRADILETYTCAYIATLDFLLRVLLVGVHLEQT